MAASVLVFDTGAASMVILLADIGMGYSAAFTGTSDSEAMKRFLEIPNEYPPVVSYQ